MSRPWRRPTECMRRAWHNERHQAIRGTIIQELFRMACEIHGDETRKNKEWQEKLPFVVMRVEEIIYSMANTQEEYMELKTLMDRANVAIDTIVRNDDTLQTCGHLLKPCIEAALNLGCVPMRTSRRTYLDSGFDITSRNTNRNAAPLGRVYPLCSVLTSRDDAYHDFLHVGQVGKGGSDFLPNHDGGSECRFGFDLSLRLGCTSLEDRILVGDNGLVQEDEEMDFDSSCYQ